MPNASARSDAHAPAFPAARAQQEQHLGQGVPVARVPRRGQALLSEGGRPGGVAGEHRRVAQAEQGDRLTGPVGGRARLLQRRLMVAR